MNRRSRRVLAAIAAIALFSSLLASYYLTESPDPHADPMVQMSPFPSECWQQTLMSGRW
jgi:hypothetical protein